MEKVNINGVTIAYERLGKGAPLLLIHGFPLDHTSWHLLYPLLEHQFDLILPDLRGMGESSASDNVYSIDDLAADLTGLLDALGLPAAFVAGHSMGGYVALAFARRFPGRTLGLGLVGSQALPDTPERKAGRYSTAEQVAAQGVEAVMGMAEKLAANAELTPLFREIIQRQKPSGVIGSLKAMAERPDSTPALSAFRFPVVLIHGQADNLIPVERSREMRDAIPQAALIELLRIGHTPAVEAPVETANALMKYLR